MLPEIYVLI